MDDYTIDISTDVHDAQLMQDESGEDTMLRLGLKHLWPDVRERKKSSDNIQKGSNLQKRN